MSILDDDLDNQTDKIIEDRYLKEEFYAKDLSCTFSAYGVIAEDKEDVLTEKTSEAWKRNLNYKTSFAEQVEKRIKEAINPKLKEHQSRNIYSIDCRGLRKGDAYGWLSAIAKASIDPIVIIEYVTQIPDGDRTIYDDPNYVANLLLRSWKNDDIYVGDLHIDRRKFTVILTCPPEDTDILQRECGLCSYSWIGDIDENDKTGIVLNRMYTGSYLSTNLGHEVINMFQADNGKHYLYLNSKGNFSERGKEVGTMLLVRGIGDKRVEVVGLAKSLTYVKSAQCTLPRDLGRINKQIQEKQNAFMNEQDIKYGGVSIQKIFDGKGQQSVFISYYTDENCFFLPNKPIIINFSSDASQPDVSSDTYKTYLSLNFASTSLHQFVNEDTEQQNWTKLQRICDDTNLWTLDNTKVSVPKDFSEREDSLFDICRIQDDENRFSNALSYFIEKYPVLWKDFLKSRLKDVDLAEIESVTREENAKVENEMCKLPTGGRIDLLIRTNNCYIVVENKIDSGIINEDGISQIQRYYNYVLWLKKEEKDKLVNELNRIRKRRDKRKEQYEGLKNKQGKHGLTWEEELAELEEQIKMLNKELLEVEAREFRGFVLSPNYNKPLPKEYEVDGYEFEELLYSDIYSWLEKNALFELDSDSNFKAFHNAMKKHTFETQSEALYEEMKNSFFSRINKLKPNEVNKHD